MTRSQPRRRLRRGIIAAGLVVLIITGVLAWRFRWYKLPYYMQYPAIDLPLPILTADQYTEIIAKHTRPFVFQIDSPGGGALLMFGAEHTKDPSNQQILDICKRWGEFRPTVALCESRLGFFIGGLGPGVKQFGEPGAVFALARSSGIEVYTWEPPREQIIEALLKEFPADRVALALALGPYFSNFRHGKPSDPDAFVEDYRAKRLTDPRLAAAIPSVHEIDAMWRRDFAGQPDWRDTSDQFGLPGYLRDISERTNAMRDEHFARVVIDLVRKGGRVFAVAGSSHAVKLEPALRAALSQPPPTR